MKVDVSVTETQLKKLNDLGYDGWEYCGNISSTYAVLKREVIYINNVSTAWPPPVKNTHVFSRKRSATKYTFTMTGSWSTSDGWRAGRKPNPHYLQIYTLIIRLYEHPPKDNRTHIAIYFKSFTKLNMKYLNTFLKLWSSFVMMSVCILLWFTSEWGVALGFTVIYINLFFLNAFMAGMLEYLDD